MSDDVAELILGHVRPGIAGVYNRSQPLAEPYRARGLGGVARKV